MYLLHKLYYILAIVHYIISKFNGISRLLIVLHNIRSIPENVVISKIFPKNEDI